MKLAVIAQRGLKSSQVVYKKITTSIAFIPAVIVIFFLFLSYFIVQFDFSETGKAIKANAHWLTLKDASTARRRYVGIISLRHYQ